LAPTPYASGTSEVEQGISKAGNKRARWLLVELAWNWLRFQPGEPVKSMEKTICQRREARDASALSRSLAVWRSRCGVIWTMARFRSEQG